MSALDQTREADTPLPAGPFLWTRQIRGVLALELRKTLFGRRSLLVYLIAGAPVGLSALILILTLIFGDDAGGGSVFASFYFHFVLMMVTFFGAASIFTNLFRGEILDRSLHYYFLVPLRRSVLVTGKFLAGLLSSWILFGGATFASYWLLMTTFSVSSKGQFAGGSLGQALGFTGTTMLACVGYGAIFLSVGLLFRNPFIPAIMIWGWESINFLLPPVLKKISVVHYLRSIVPIPVPVGPFALLAEPTPLYLSLPGLLLLAAVALLFASWRIRHMEIDYGND